MTGRPDDAAEQGDLAPAVAETHSGIVFFVGDLAHKMKKPVDLGFLDFRTREAREAVCHREVELNRRLAPDVYLGVADVTGPDGELCEHLVVMRRMPTDRRLSRLVTEGHDVDAALDELAAQLADFHARAERSARADELATSAAQLARWTANTREMQALSRWLPAERVAAVQAMAERYLAGRGRLFDQRIAAGRACDGHGDLLADDVFVLDDGPRVLDCLEFDDDLRLGDVLADVAFLAMDLERLARADLADRFLSAYRRSAHDEWPDSLAHHHIAYRAQVRAKVTAIRAEQGATDVGPEAGRLLDLAHHHLDAARVRLVLVGGLPGTGKSTLSRELAERTGAVVLRSDEIRKQLSGLAPSTSAAAAFGEGIYDASTTDATYAELLRRARDLLELGESVVLDASWSRGAHREQARQLATATASELVELRCDAPAEVAAQRMRERARRGGDPSDADAQVAAAMAATADAWPEATTVDTVPGVEAAATVAVAAYTQRQEQP